MRRFLYYILKEDGRSGKVVNKTVTYSGSPSPLPQTPIGWQDLLLEYERTDKHGIDGSVSLPMGMVRDAALISRDALYRETVEAKLFVLIQRLYLEINNTKFKWLYKYFYKGELNLAKADDSLDVIKIPISESSLKKIMEAGEKKVFEFPLIDRRCVWVKMDGINKSFTKKFTVQENQEVYGTANFYLGMFQQASEGQSPNVAFFDVDFQTSSAYPNDDYFQEVVDVQSVRIKGEVTIFYNKSVSPVMRVETNIGGGFPQYDLIPFSAARPIGTQETIPFDVSFSMTAAGRYNMKLFGGSGVDSTTQFTVVGGEIEIFYDYRKPTTYHKAWKRFDLYSEVIKKITGNESYAESELCKEFDYLVITSGQGLRNSTDAVVKTSFDEFYKDTDCTLMCGLNILPEKIKLEGRETFYSEANVVDLGTVTDFVKRPAEDKMCNTFGFGHKKQSVEDVNGKFDPNGNNEFSGPLTKPTAKKYDGISPYKAGPFEIETMRTSFEGLETTDDNRDNSTFVLACKKLSNLIIASEFSATLQGVIVSDSERFFPGQQLIVSNTAFNNGTYDVDTVTDNVGGGRLVKFLQSVIDEVSAVSSFEFVLGEMVELNRPVWDTLEGVPNDTIFNIVYLTPKWMMKRHGRWIRSMNAGLDTKKITFNSGKENENTELKTVLAGEIYDENLDETISLLGNYLYLPWYFIFKTDVPINLPEIIEDDPNISFKITDEFGNDWIGFNMVAGIAPNDYTPQEYKLLATPSNDILKLIHG